MKDQDVSLKAITLMAAASFSEISFQFNTRPMRLWWTLHKKGGRPSGLPLGLKFHLLQTLFRIRRIVE